MRKNTFPSFLAGGKKSLGLLLGLALIGSLAGCGVEVESPDIDKIGSLASSGLEYAGQQAKTVADQAIQQAQTQATQVADQAKQEAQKQYQKLKEDAKNGIKDSVNKKIDDTFEKF
ncbi:hypothetical protein HXK74_01355 [Candidatus Gracilibacteria bacterium]|nr:hypothetical protein [Candidatus Gracilibacteria bacterium]